MFTVYVVTNMLTNEYKNVIDIQVREITYVQIQVIIKHSIFPENKEELIIDKENLVAIHIYPEWS